MHLWRQPRNFISAVSLNGETIVYLFWYAIVSPFFIKEVHI